LATSGDRHLAIDMQTAQSIRVRSEPPNPPAAEQRSLLHRLVDAVEADQRWEWLELSCSVAAGRGDALSDLDVGLGYAGTEAPAVAEVTAMLQGLGPVVDLSAQPYEGRPRWWVQYTNGGQIDLVVMAAQDRAGRAPGSVALLDRAGRLAQTFTPSVWAAGAGDPENWLLDGWEAMSNVAKYLQRGSVLEAIEQLHRARGRIYQLWAVGEAVPYPAFGIVSLLDDQPPCLPPGIEDTYAVAAPGSVRTAAIAAGALLAAAGGHAQPGLDTALRGYVSARLQETMTPDLGTAFG